MGCTTPPRWIFKRNYWVSGKKWSSILLRAFTVQKDGGRVRIPDPCIWDIYLHARHESIGKCREIIPIPWILRELNSNSPLPTYQDCLWILRQDLGTIDQSWGDLYGKFWFFRSWPFLGVWFVTFSGLKTWPPFWDIKGSLARSWWSGFCWNVLWNSLFKGLVFFGAVMYFLPPLKIPWVGRWHFPIELVLLQGTCWCLQGCKMFVLRAFLKNMAKFSPHRFLLWKDRSLGSPFGSGFLGGLTNHPFGSDIGMLFRNVRWSTWIYIFWWVFRFHGGCMQAKSPLGGGFKYLLFSPLPGKMIQLELIVFKWVETTN